MNVTDEKILRGLLSLYLLREICISPKCGYELNKNISEKLGVVLPKGTVYVLLKSLFIKGYIQNEKVINTKGKNTLIYRITDSGNEFMRSHYQPLHLARGIIDDILLTIDRNL